MAAPPTTDSAKSGQHGARHEQSGTGQGRKRAPQIHTGAAGVHAVFTSHRATIIVKAPAVAGVSGSTIGHYTRATPAVGGPAHYDARKGAVINGTGIRRNF